MLGFSHAQLGGRAWGLLMFGAGCKAVGAIEPRWVVYAWAARRRGRAATWIPALAFEELLPLPLDVVQHIAGLADPTAAHPAGVLRGTWSAANARC